MATLTESNKPIFKTIKEGEIDNYFKSYLLRKTPFEDYIVDIWTTEVPFGCVRTEEEFFKEYLLITSKGYYIPVGDIWKGENKYRVLPHEIFETPYELYLDGIYRLLYCYFLDPDNNRKTTLEILQKGKIVVGKNYKTGVYSFGFTFPYYSFIRAEDRDN